MQSDKWTDRQKVIKGLLKQGDAQTALELAKAGQTDFPDLSGPHLEAARVYLAMGKPGKAHNAMRAARKLGAKDRALSRLDFEICLATDDYARFCRIAVKCVDNGVPIKHRHTQKALQLLTDAEDPAAVEKVADAFLAREYERKFALYKFYAYELVLSDDDIGAEFERILFAPEAPSDASIVIVVLARLRPNLIALCQDLARKALERWPDVEHKRRLERLIEGRDPDSDDAGPNGVPILTTVNPRTNELFLEMTHRLDERATQPGGDRLTGVGDWLRKDLHLENLPRPLIPFASRGFDVVVAENPDSADWALLFSGVLQTSPAQMQVVDAVLAQQNINIIVLSDGSRQLACNGLFRFGPELEDTTRGLSKLMSRHKPIERLTTIGISYGGLAAATMGHQLGADRMIGFSSPSSLRLDYLNLINDMRHRYTVRRINNRIPAERLDLLAMQEKTGGSLPMHFVFGDDNYIDRTHARRMEGVPGAHMWPIPKGRAHSSALDLLKMGLLPDLFAGRLNDMPKSSD